MSSELATISARRIVKRSGRIDTFDDKKIQSAVLRCLRNTEGLYKDNQQECAKELTDRVLASLPKHRVVTVEAVQDAIETAMLEIGLGRQAVAYHNYRTNKTKQREESPIDTDTQTLFDSSKKYFQTPLQLFQYYDKYSRWMPEKGRRETWPETVDRVIAFLIKNVQVSFSSEEWTEMSLAMLHMDALPSMRAVQMAGPALERCNAGLYNCAAVALKNIDSFAELLYVLMQGTGCSFSVEDRYISRLPKIKKQRRTPAIPYAISDSTEGWCDALKIGMQAWFAGHDIDFDFRQIRPAGSILRTKGGRSAGPGPLKDLLNFSHKIILAKQGKKLQSLDCHDIACYIGYIVQVGGVRRAAELSLSDLDDTPIAECKTGTFWKDNPQRMMANNSAVYEEKPAATEFMEEWLNLAKSGTGERGIFNRSMAIPDRRRRGAFIPNPCGEISLLDSQFCNLSICVAREKDTLQDLERKVRIAAMFGTAQCTLTHFPYLSPAWKANCETERLLGVDITGQRDCAILRGPYLEEILCRLKYVAVDANRILAERFGINQSVAVTCIKPSGNSSTLLDCSSGIHPRYAPYYIRRVRTGVTTPVARLLKDSGVPYSVETGQDAATATVLVFEFPVKSPDGSVCCADLTAKDQFAYWLANRECYTEHSVSCTLYVEDSEWLSLGALVYDNWDKISGLSFLPKTGHIYPLAPYEEITAEEYKKRTASFPDINWAKLIRYEKTDETSQALDFACTSGSCEV